MEIKIYKSRKILEVWEAGKLKKTCSIAIGKSEKGHKEKEGDQKTPEGEYKVCAKNPKSKYYLSLGLNYPNRTDAKAGLEKGGISKEQYTAICEADAKGEVPPWGTPLGGEIFIHGELEKQSWSIGCIRLKNADIKALFDRVEIGTKVTIHP